MTDWEAINKKLEELIYLMKIDNEVIGVQGFDIRQIYETGLSITGINKLDLNIKLLVKPKKHFVNEIRDKFKHGTS